MRKINSDRSTFDIIGNANSLRLYFLYEHESYPDWFARVQMLNYEIRPLNNKRLRSLQSETVK
ncbi:hypothetical protein [Desulfonatronovibrio magnus]|uniref:hypothetical protein n=1 Tax=Desulfonatronovibrio magnus TaxID=698827 RepID=UPI00339055AB